MSHREVNAFTKFRSMCGNEYQTVKPSDGAQKAARLLLKHKQIVAYERLDGTIGEIGAPAKPEHGGRVWRSAHHPKAKRRRRVAA